MSDVIYLTQPQNMLEYLTGICECGKGSFQTLFGLEDPKFQARHLIALRCADIITRGAILRRWQQPIDYPSGAWVV